MISKKIAITATILCSIVALCLVGFGVFYIIKQKKSADREKLEKLLKQQLGLLDKRFQEVKNNKVIASSDFLTKEIVMKFIERLGIKNKFTDSDLEDITINFGQEILNAMLNFCDSSLKKAIEAPLENLDDKLINERVSKLHNVLNAKRDLSFFVSVFMCTFDNLAEALVCISAPDIKPDDIKISEMNNPEDCAERTMDFFNKKLKSIGIDEEISCIKYKIEFYKLFCDDVLNLSFSPEVQNRDKPNETKVQQEANSSLVLPVDVSQQK